MKKHPSSYSSIPHCILIQEHTNWMGLRYVFYVIFLEYNKAETLLQQNVPNYFYELFNIYKTQFLHT